jgi:hypothetical protein
MAMRNGWNLLERPGVCDDWIRALPRDKSRIFEAVVRRWECTYAMTSVALDDAISLRTGGELVCACQQVSVAVDLLRGLSSTVVGCCEILIRRGRGLGNMPSVEPMRAEFFRGDTGKSAASWNSILHHLLFGDRARFLHKLRILSETLAQIEEQFAGAAGDLSRETSIRADSWATLDCLHYDFKTCLSESEVVLKSFLRVLPAEQLEFFATEMEAPFSPKRVGRLAAVFSRAAST